MKRWWIIFDKESKSIEYHNIIKFITNTFKNNKIEFELIPNSEINYRNLLYWRKKELLPDISIFWCKENYKQKRLLDSFNIDVINSYNESLIVENKFLQLKKISYEPNIIPNTIFTNTYYIDRLINEMTSDYPIVLKLSNSTLGSGVFFISSQNQLIEICSRKDVHKKDIMIQEYLSYAPKNIVKVCFYNNLILSSYIQYEHNNEVKLSPHHITKKEKSLILKVANILNLKFSSVDIIYKARSNPLICEVNNLPNILKTYKATNINIIEKIIDLYT